MTPFRGTHRWIAWLALALLACVPVRAAAGDAWLWSLGDPVCEQASTEPCEELGHGDTHHCHCLDTGFPKSSRHSPGSIPLGSILASFDPPVLVVSQASDAFLPPSPSGVEGPPSGSPFASRVGLTLHD